MLNVISEYIVAGTDKYQGYTGGTYVENVISFEPFESEITLIPPETTVVSEEAEAEEGNDVSGDIIEPSGRGFIIKYGWWNALLVLLVVAF